MGTKRVLKQQLDPAEKDEAAWVKRCEVLLAKNDELREEARSSKELNNDRKHERKVANRQSKIDEDFKGIGQNTNVY